MLQVAILGTGAYLAMQQEISGGIMVATSIIMGRALAPVEQAVGQWKEFIAARQANGRLKKLFDTLPAEDMRLRQESPKGHLTVGVSTVVPGTRDTILRSVSFDLPAGMTMALIGPSGSGKSTLARHLVGVGDPIGGAIRLDGVELSHWDHQSVGSAYRLSPTRREVVLGYCSREYRPLSGGGD